MKIDATLGVISEDPLLRKQLSEFAERYGFTLGVSVSPDIWQASAANKQTKIDCWFVDEPSFETDAAGVEDFLDQVTCPVIYGLEPFSRDQGVRDREFISLLKTLIRHLTKEQLSTDIDIWVLAASLGGPEAIKEFLDALPTGLPVCFLYAQHLDEVGSRALVDVIGRDAKLSVVALGGLMNLQREVVYKVPVSGSVDFTPDVCYQTGQPWTGIYQPSIDELLRRASFTFGDRLNVIYFSGMGDDGSETAKELSTRGSLVWAQSIQSSASTAMPEAIIKQGVCQRIASPKELAMLLVAHYQRKAADSCQPTSS